MTTAEALIEGVGAAVLVALLRHRERFAGRNVGLVLCGGNIELSVERVQTEVVGLHAVSCGTRH